MNQAQRRHLHRHDLTIDERSDHRRAWIRLRAQRGAKDGQLDQLSAKGGRGNEGGLSLAVREMPKLDAAPEEDGQSVQLAPIESERGSGQLAPKPSERERLASCGLFVVMATDEKCQKSQ